MIVFAVILVVLLLSLWLGAREDWDGFLWPLVAIASAICLIVALSMVPVCRAEAATKRAEIAALRETVQRARASGRDPLESAAINLEIAKANGWIASAKYWNGTSFDVFWPDWIDELEPVE